MSAQFSLHLTTNDSGLQQRGAIVAALSRGVDVIQVREPSRPDQEVRDLVSDLVQVAPMSAARIIVNRRLDLLSLGGVDGAHLPAHGVQISEAREAGALIVGRSVHSREEALAAGAEGADYVTFGHIFPTPSHPGEPGRGVDALADVVAAVEIPVIAIGGITVDNVDLVLAMGCSGIAVISAILGQDDPARATGDLRRTLDDSPFRPRIAFPPAGR